VTRARRATGREGAGVWEDALRAAGTLSVLRSVLDDPVGRAWRQLVESVTARPLDPGRVADAYGRLFTLLAAEIELSPGPLVGDAWQHHLLSRLLDDENPFSLKAERAPFREIGPALVVQTRADLASLQACHRLNGAAMAEAARRITGLPPAPWDRFRPLAARAAGSARVRMMRRLHAAPSWGDLVRELADYFWRQGVGLFARFRAFRWVHVDGRGRLEGVPQPDPVRLDDLVGYELERQPVVENTLQFLAGAPANNVLLYGDRGTGKSSTVKALLNEFGDLGLRLIEVAKEHLSDYPEVLAFIRGRRERFILFVDDLSFEEHETQYKALKAVLEGSVEARPDNVVLYATSNRRHLVTERWGDRQAAPADDVHPEETTQEKLSLVDRFGIHAPFLLPDQERYLRIVESLAARYGLRVPSRELRRRALLWAQWHNGRSCRTARQFIEALRGEALVTASEDLRKLRPS
jgi:predicted AAA+ superfamily ATPase